MPVLDIDLDNVETTDRTIKALMLYPDDPVGRQNFFDLYQASSMTRQRRTGGNAGADDAFVHYQHVQSRLHALTCSDTTRQLERGKIAGGVLVLIKQMRDHGGEESTNKAVYLLEHWVKDAGIVSDVSTLESEIWKYWKQFRSVAHLWADFYLHACGGILHWRTSYSSRDNLLAFLARADYFRRFGVNHSVKRSLTPVLPPEDLWTVPDDVPLPTIEVDVPPLTEKQQDIVATYSHHTRGKSPY
jgi:hypothetical protein